MIPRLTPPSGSPIVTTPLRTRDYGALVAEINDWVLLDSGTSALALALLDARDKYGAGPGARCEVMVPAYCCPQILTAARYAGLTPVLVDLEPDTPWLDLEQLRLAITPATVAVVAINFCGVPERVAAIKSIIGSRRIGFVYDACQTFPSRVVEPAAADYVIVSFGRGKPVSILGGGGLIVTACLGKLAAARLAHARMSAGALRLRFALPAYRLACHPVVFPALDILGLSGRTRYAQPREIRLLNPSLLPLLCANIHAYRAAKSDTAHGISRIIGATNGQLIDLGALSGMGEDARFWRYPALAPSESVRDRLIERLRQLGVGASPLYGAALPGIRGVALDVSEAECPAAREFAKRLITLPCHAGVTARQLRRLPAAFECKAQ